MGTHNVDWDKTRLLRGKSRVYLDGREVLGALDWKKRKLELHHRSQGQCERLAVLKREHAPGCSRLGEEPHHIVRRSKLRDDRLSNLCNLSHACHRAEDGRETKWSKK